MRVTSSRLEPAPVGPDEVAIQPANTRAHWSLLRVADRSSPKSFVRQGLPQVAPRERDEIIEGTSLGQRLSVLGPRG
jgi:hypothetical protein